jgi:hypothetical protein
MWERRGYLSVQHVFRYLVSFTCLLTITVIKWIYEYQIAFHMQTCFWMQEDVLDSEPSFIKLNTVFKWYCCLLKKKAVKSAWHTTDPEQMQAGVSRSNESVSHIAPWVILASLMCTLYEVFFCAEICKLHLVAERERERERAPSVLFYPTLSSKMSHKHEMKQSLTVTRFFHHFLFL